MVASPPTAPSVGARCAVSGLPIAYDAELLDERFRQPDGQAFLQHRLRLAGVATLRLSGAVLSTYFALLLGVAPPGVGPTALEDALARRAPEFRQAIEELGPTFVKFGQALGSRPDLIGPRLARSLRTLQTQMTPFDTELARAIIAEDLGSERAKPILQALPSAPIAAASIGQVYRVELPPTPLPSSAGWRRRLVRSAWPPEPELLALKVMRPDARMAVAADAVLARRAAAALESLRGIGGDKLIQPALVSAVDEFFSRLFEEMDYVGEAQNIKLFGETYGPGGLGRRALGNGGEIVLPETYDEWSAERVLCMSWMEGEPIVPPEGSTDMDILPAEIQRRLKIPAPRPRGERAEELRLVRWGISCTLSQLLVTGVMHADTHGGNLLRVKPKRKWWRLLRPFRSPPPHLGYVDFGLVSRVPQRVRDGLICAVAQLLFARDTAKVAALFDELMLLPTEALGDKDTRQRLEVALAKAADRLLVYTPGASIPELRFDALVGEVASIAPAFAFELPPYFLNNARALASLEGLARATDPSFSIVSSVYPFALKTLLADKTGSPLLRATLDDLATDTKTGRLSLRKMRQLIAQLASLSRKRKLVVYWDVFFTRGGRRLLRQWIQQQLKVRLCKL